MSTQGSPSHSHRGTRTRSRTSAPISSGTAPRSLQAVDAGLIVVIGVVPFLFGGRQSGGQLVLSLAACWVAISWAVHQVIHSDTKLIWSRAEPLLLAGIGLGLLQITGLPTQFVEMLSPQIAERLPLWSTAETTSAMLGAWSSLSLSPAASESGLVTFVSYALIFFVAVQRIRNLADLERLLRWIGLAVSAMALFGLAQFLTGNGKFFWFYEHPYTDTSLVPKGAFTNRNHFAQFLALGIGPLIWWIVSALKNRADSSSAGGFGRPGTSTSETTVGLLSIATGTVIFAGLLCLSRGGTLAIFGATFVCLTILFTRRLISGALLGGLAASALLVSALLSIYGYDSVSNRLEDWESDARWEIWQANLKILSDFPLFGTGIGSHRDAYHIYFNRPVRSEFTHAENSYLQIASETGLAGLSLALLAIGWTCWWCIQAVRRSTSDREMMIAAALSASLAACFLHAFVDFIWYVPGCMGLVCIIAAGACRLSQLTRPASDSQTSPVRGTARLSGTPRWIPVTTTVGLLFVGMWMIQVRWPELRAEAPWHDYLRLQFARADQSAADDVSPDDVEADHALLRDKLKALAAASSANPNDARIQLAMVRGYLNLFHVLQQDNQNQMTLAQIRNAALASEFESHDALLDWLNRAFGDNVKYLQSALKRAKHAIALAPLQGHGYLYLSELDFMDDAHRISPEDYIAQALLVRPHDGQVLFAAGREAWLAGEIEPALDYWKRSALQDDAYQQRIVELLADRVPAQFLVDHFDLSPRSLAQLKRRYQETRPQDFAVVVAQIAAVSVDLARQADETEQVVKHLLTASNAFQELSRKEAAEKCLRLAFNRDPNSYNVRYAFGSWLYKQEQYAEAAEHLVWCSRRKPKNASLQRMAEQATKERLKNQDSQWAADSPTVPGRL